MGTLKIRLMSVVILAATLCAATAFAQTDPKAKKPAKAKAAAKKEAPKKEAAAKEVATPVEPATSAETQPAAAITTADGSSANPNPEVVNTQTQTLEDSDQALKL